MWTSSIPLIQEGLGFFKGEAIFPPSLSVSLSLSLSLSLSSLSLSVLSLLSSFHLPQSLTALPNDIPTAVHKGRIGYTHS